MAISGDRVEDYETFDLEVSRKIRTATLGRTVLETGCGPGTEAIRLQMEFGANQVIATDISFGMLLAARKKYPHLLLVQADARHLPFRENAVDAVYSNCMYHHIDEPDRKLVLDESLRVSSHSVLLKEVAGFENRFLNAMYALYYLIVDGSANRPTVERWLQFLGSQVQSYIRRSERALVFRYVFFVLDSSAQETMKHAPPQIDPESNLV